jgi:hypothetical protein
MTVDHAIAFLRDETLTLVPDDVWDARRPGAPPCAVVGAALHDLTLQELVVYRLPDGSLHAAPFARFVGSYAPRPTPAAPEKSAGHVSESPHG